VDLRRGTIPILASVLVLAAAADAAPRPRHPFELPPLAPDTVFPRCSRAELASAGYPDHMHAWVWSTWEPPRGDDGLPYGPGAFCDDRTLIPRPGLVVGEDRQRFGPFELRHDARYAPCDMLPFLELLDLAHRRLSPLLGVAAPDTLVLVNPDNNDEYRELAGVGTWRLYRRLGEVTILEPIGTLQARTLDGHAAFMIVADWLLGDGVAADLPPWLHRGLVEYLAEDGVHLNNYMAEFRPRGNPLFSPPVVDVILGGEPDADPARDREMYRRACYSAFLMAWELVENLGGLDALREFLALAGDGAPLDEASRRVYGLDMAELARSLDPVELGEPIGSAVAPRRPHLQP
jgi:hypothetical protein